MMLFVLAALAADPIVEPWDFESRLKVLESRVAALESRSASFPAPAAVATPQPSPVTQPITASEFSPTWHYPPGTTLVRDANGILVPSQAATQISYPGGQMQAAPPPQFYAPPPRRGLFGGRGVFRGANCSGGS
jgi:hypothetical protein